MKKLSKRTIYLAVIGLFAQTLIAGKITIYRDSYLNNNAACPKTEYQYWVDTKDVYGKYEWKITGGYFKKWGQNVTEISEFNWANVTVVWNNVKSTNGSVPKGTITLKVYNKNNQIAVVDNGSYEQKIKSLKDILPQTPQSTSTALNYGIQTIRVTGQALNYPGITYPNGMPIPVNKYEWKVPLGWSVNGGTKTTSGTYITSYSVVDITTDYGSIGGVEVRGVNDCYEADDYTVYSYPLNFTRKGLGLIDYPKTIIAGQSNTYSITATPISGATYEWQTPSGWSINDSGNTYSGTNNVIFIKNGICMTKEKIKVRYIGPSHMYSEWLEVPTTMIAPTINLPTELKQYNLATFSLDLPVNNVNSITWKVNGVDISTVYNTNLSQFAISQNGDVGISATLNLVGCDNAIVIPSVNAYVQETELSISGPSTICDQATYTVENLPTDATVQWNSSSNLVLISSTDSTATFVTFSRMSNGWISISINGNEINRKNITIENLLTGGPEQIHTPGSYSYQVSCPKENNMWILEKYNMDTSFEQPDTCYGRNYAKISATSAPNSLFVYKLKLFSNNILESKKYIQAVNVSLSLVGIKLPVFSILSLTPNPATTFVTVGMEKESEQKLAASSTHKDTPYTIQLWNSFGLIKTVATDQKEYQLDLSGVPAGFYYIHVIKDGKMNRKQLIIK